MKVHFAIVCILFEIAASQRDSPCPETFSYESENNENDRWYGVVSLKSNEDLSGVWLRITLDQPAELIGNWFGETVSTDNIEYVIRNPKYKLEAGPPVSVRFFVKYNPSRSVPRLVKIMLNGKTICTVQQRESELGPTTPVLHISQLQPTSSGSSSNIENSRPSQNEYRHDNRPTSIGRPSSNNNGNPSSSNGNKKNNNGRRPFNNNSSNRSNRGNGQSSRPNNNRETTTRMPTYSSESVDEPGKKSNSSPSYSTPSENQGSSTYVEDDDEGSENESDFFQGDFSSILKPAQNRSSSNSDQIGSRSSSCGTVVTRATPLISHGQDTSPGQWPWHAALYLSVGLQLKYICGGTLISDYHILTAAHCVTKPQSNRDVNPSNLLVYLGKYNLISFGSEVQDRSVSNIYVHPEYNHTVLFNDIAVLKLSNPVKITNSVRPCCLWEGDTNLENVLREEGTVVGWGFDHNGKLTNNLMQAKMPIVSTVDCIFSNRDFYSRFVFERNYCAGFRNGTSVCNGDSGGAMVFPRRGSSGQNTVWQIRGLVSVGVALQGQRICDTSQYVVFTDVAKHNHWIRQVLAN